MHSLPFLLIRQRRKEDKHQRKPHQEPSLYITNICQNELDLRRAGLVSLAAAVCFLQSNLWRCCKRKISQSPNQASQHRTQNQTGVTGAHMAACARNVAGTLNGWIILLSTDMKNLLQMPVRCCVRRLDCHDFAGFVVADCGSNEAKRMKVWRGEERERERPNDKRRQGNSHAQNESGRA